MKIPTPAIMPLKPQQWDRNEMLEYIVVSMDRRDDIVAHSNVDNSPLAGRVAYAAVALVGLCFLVACFGMFISISRLFCD